jgi:hypothetical protein
MPNFTFICEYDSGERITYETSKDYLPDVITDFQMFLKGAGYSFDGELDFREEEVSRPTSEEDFIVFSQS